MQLYDIMTVFPALASRQLELKQAKLAMAVGTRLRLLAW